MGEKKKPKPWEFSPLVPPKHKGRGMGEASGVDAHLAFFTESPEHVRCAFLSKTLCRWFGPQVGQDPTSRNRGHSSGPCPGTPLSPPLVPRGGERAQGRDAGCSAPRGSWPQFCVGIPRHRWFSGHWVILNYTSSPTSQRGGTMPGCTEAGPK